jgi:hypothetical protein
MKAKLEKATKALREEVIKAIRIDIWHPMHTCTSMNYMKKKNN